MQGVMGFGSLTFGFHSGLDESYKLAPSLQRKNDTLFFMHRKLSLAKENIGIYAYINNRFSEPLTHF